jgi:chitodextrinase
VLQVWLDNSLVGDLSSTAVDVGAAPVGSLQIGEVQSGRTYDVAFDDAAFGTSRLGPVGDSTPPSTPTGLAATAPSGFEADLTWNPSSDDSGIAGYDVLRDGARVATVTGTSYTDTNVLPGTTYHYAVRARDLAGNTSALSDPIPVTTPAASTPMFADGFETGDSSAWTASTRLTVENDAVSTGSYSAKGNTTSGATWARETLPGSYTTGYARVAFDVLSSPRR